LKQSSHLCIFIFCASLAAGVSAQTAQTYPTKTIRYIVPFAPGGTTDILGRLVSQKLHDAWGQQVVVDNRPGAGGALGAELAAKAPPDGYTIMGGTISTHAINASVYTNLSYDPIKDFEAVTLLATQPNMLVVNPSIPAKTVKELIALLKAGPNKYTYSTSGNGTSAHLSGELFKSMTGTTMQHVPYKGSPQALADVIGGQVSMSFDNISTAYVQVKSGKLRGLAVTTVKRSDIAPEIPTMAEAGLPGYELGSWHGVFAPAGTPKDIIEKLNGEIVKALKTADMREKLHALGVEPVGTTSAAFAAFVKAEVPKWAKVVKESGAKVE
jgi:tripartite-type tricarboxylate transporter receptor subunit TctC